MILSYASFFILAYTLIRFVLPLPWGPGGKLLLAVTLLAVSLKFHIYERFGGFLFAPALPRPVILSLEWLYAAPVCPGVCRYHPTHNASELPWPLLR